MNGYYGYNYKYVLYLYLFDWIMDYNGIVSGYLTYMLVIIGGYFRVPQFSEPLCGFNRES